MSIDTQAASSKSELTQVHFTQVLQYYTARQGLVIFPAPMGTAGAGNMRLLIFILC